MGMHRIDQRRDGLGRRVLADAVTEVEDVPRMVAIAVEHPTGFGGDLRRIGEQHVRIQIALQRHLVADARARDDGEPSSVLALSVENARVLSLLLKQQLAEVGEIAAQDLGPLAAHLPRELLDDD